MNDPLLPNSQNGNSANSNDMSWIAGAASAAGSIVGDVANLFGTSAANRQTQQFQKDMYAQQRKDALADWNMQNAYNAPSAQMQRYKDAGLNPNLIYGQQNTSGAIRSSSPGSFQARPAQFQSPQALGNVMLTAQDYRVKDVQTDNVAANTAVTNQELNNKKLVADGLGLENDMRKKQLGIFDADFNSQMDFRAAQIRKANADTALTLTDNEKASIMMAPDYETAVIKLGNYKLQNLQMQQDMLINAQRIQLETGRFGLEAKRTKAQIDEIGQTITNMKQALQNAQNTGTLQQQEIQLWDKFKLNKNDPLWPRMVLQGLGTITGQGLGDVISQNHIFGFDVEKELQSMGSETQFSHHGAGGKW